MSKDTVKLYQRARAALQKEKIALSKTLTDAQAMAADAEKRLAEIEAALDGAGSAPAKRRGRPGRKKSTAKRGHPAKKKAASKRKAAKKKTVKKAVKKRARKAAKKTAKKGIKKTARKTAKKKAAKGGKKRHSLKEIALQVAKGKVLTAGQILEEVKKAGHKFGGKNPINGLRVMLYNNKKAFKSPSKGKFTAA